MAEMLSQNDIDNLLSGEIGDVPEDTSSNNNELDSTSKSNVTYFRNHEKPSFRFHYKYRSPILKREKFILDPDAEDDLTPGTIIVRTLNSYKDNGR